MVSKRFAWLLPVVAVLLIVAAFATPAGAFPRNKTIDVQILAINDFHGNLEPPAGSSGRIDGITAGGVQYLATHINNLRATNPNTVVVSAGDLVGASPLLSALFHDEPTIEAFNKIGLDINAVGNHEFDEGGQELLRLQKGGCHPVDGCLDGDGFKGARFKFLAANVFSTKTGKTIFPSYEIRTFRGGVKVGFIGMTLEGTPLIVTPSGVAGLEFRDEADTVNALIQELKRRHVKTIVVLIHEGGAQVGGDRNTCNGISGAIVDIVNRTDPEVDLFITGHTHNAYNCVIGGRPVTSASSFGRVVTDLDLTINVFTGQPISITANNVAVDRTVPLYAGLTSLLAKYKALADPIANQVVGTVTTDILRAANPAGESALGDVIADAQLAATAPADQGGAVIALMNPGGIRADFTYLSSAVGEGDGNVTYGEVFTVQPFGNNLVTMTYTGAQIDAILEQQWDQVPGGRYLQVSNGFTYTYDFAAPIGSRIDPATIMLNGVVLDPAGTYRVTMNSFLADGGDGFTAFTAGVDRLGGEVDLDALVAYFEANSPIAPGPMNRITRLN